MTSSFISFCIIGLALLALFKFMASLSHDHFFKALWDGYESDGLGRLYVWSRRKVSSGESAYILSVFVFQMRFLETSTIGLLVANLYVHFLQGLRP